jgi:hypothetical protein
MSVHIVLVAGWFAGKGTKTDRRCGRQSTCTAALAVQSSPLAPRCSRRRQTAPLATSAGPMTHAVRCIRHCVGRVHAQARSGWVCGRPCGLAAHASVGNGGGPCEGEPVHPRVGRRPGTAQGVPCPSAAPCSRATPTPSASPCPCCPSTLRTTTQPAHTSTTATSQRGVSHYIPTYPTHRCWLPRCTSPTSHSHTRTHTHASPPGPSSCPSTVTPNSPTHLHTQTSSAAYL